MAKTTTRFVCQACGGVSPKWMGRCPECGEWNTLAEEVARAAPTSLPNRWPGRRRCWPAGGKAARRSRMGAARSGPRPITEIEATLHERSTTFIGEFDRVLGGGVVPGSCSYRSAEIRIGKFGGSERVFDPCTGAYLPITDWAAQRRPVLALEEETGGLVPAAVSAFHQQGCAR